MNEDINEFPVWKFVLFGLGVAVSITISLTAWLFTRITNVSDRLIAIENSRCTYQQCSATSNSLANLQARVDKMPTEIPPQWFRDKVASNTQRIAILERTSVLKKDLGRQDE